MSFKAKCWRDFPDPLLRDLRFYSLHLTLSSKEDTMLKEYCKWKPAMLVITDYLCWSSCIFETIINVRKTAESQHQWQNITSERTWKEMQMYVELERSYPIYWQELQQNTSLNEWNGHWVSVVTEWKCESELLCSDKQCAARPNQTKDN